MGYLETAYAITVVSVGVTILLASAYLVLTTIGSVEVPGVGKIDLSGVSSTIKLLLILAVLVAVLGLSTYTYLASYAAWVAASS